MAASSNSSSSSTSFSSSVGGTPMEGAPEGALETSGTGTLVRANYNFKGAHNDELNLVKGALITVSQRLDGGWWEGTLNGKTGWFPSNYVTEVPQVQRGKAAPPTTAPSPSPASQESPALGRKSRSDERGPISEEEGKFRQQVVNDLIRKEKDFVAELKNLNKKFLEPLHRAELITEREYRQLVGNLDELTEIHKTLTAGLEEAACPSPRKQRLGRVLLCQGANLREAHFTYWGNHPKAVCILEQHRDALDAFMTGQWAATPGLMTLTTALSKPLRHLERYPGLAQELEQHLEDDHPDRGDTQRSIAFYKAITTECTKLRRQKELELEVLTGTIRNWEGEAIGSLGEIVHMGSVAVGADHKDRYLVLFPANLLVLSVSNRMSAFIYEGKLPLSGISVNRLEDANRIINSFEITGPMIERILVVCQSKPDSLKWVELLQMYIKQVRINSSSGGGSHPPLPPHKSLNSSPSTQSKRLNPRSPPDVGLLWKMSCLRPAPPTRSFTGNAGRSSKKKDSDTTYEEDMQILRVIEAYCTSNKRHTQAASALFENPPVVLADGRSKSYLAGSQEARHPVNGTTTSSALDDRNVADTVFSIRDQVVNLRRQNKEVLKMLEEEIAARKRLEIFVRNNVKTDFE